MKIATWNVNSLKVRLPHVLDWLAAARPDVLCLQELKLDDPAFPFAALEEAGYRAACNGQKTYNGVAILSPHALNDVSRDIPGFDDAQRRIIAATVCGVRIVCGYFPNGQAVGSEKFAYKLRWLEALTAWLETEMKTHERLVLAGDFNIAPQDCDVPPDWKDGLLVSAPERAAFEALTALGLADSFRLFEQPERSYSWWDYRLFAFRRNFGLRIDHLLVSPALRASCRTCLIDRAPRGWDRPSDHAPVVLELLC